MAIDVLQALDVIEVMENYLQRIRPPEEIRAKLDIAYKIEGQSIIVFEIRPHWKNPNEMAEFPVAKTTFVKTNNHWKVFWMKSDLKWHAYSPKSIVKSIKEFTQLIEEDKYHCFWG
ncbi:MAG: DUF3024 domain-containing protein [Bacteroidetes bacterium]|uniref:DUF3024 domain-containing protein n=1 Tax=Phnomibacter sp. TaxID=2836217 RepID=UPI002FDEDBD6|nr:DUF3024 domain-containing protein [Bacteroidota bacterium]